MNRRVIPETAQGSLIVRPNSDACPLLVIVILNLPENNNREMFQYGDFRTTSLTCAQENGQFFKVAYSLETVFFPPRDSP